MVVSRRTVLVHKPSFDEALELLVKLRQRMAPGMPSMAFRIYASALGPFDTSTCACETETRTTLDQQLAQLNTESPDGHRVRSVVYALAGGHGAGWDQ